MTECAHTSMDGIAAGAGLWWCWGCERPIITEPTEQPHIQRTRLATYADIDRIVIEEHARLVGEVEGLRDLVEQALRRHVIDCDECPCDLARAMAEEVSAEDISPR